MFVSCHPTVPRNGPDPSKSLLFLFTKITRKTLFSQFLTNVFVQKINKWINKINKSDLSTLTCLGMWQETNIFFRPYHDYIYFTPSSFWTQTGDGDDEEKEDDDEENADDKLSTCVQEKDVPKAALAPHPRPGQCPCDVAPSSLYSPLHTSRPRVNSGTNNYLYSRSVIGIVDTIYRVVEE